MALTRLHMAYGLMSFCQAVLHNLFLVYHVDVFVSVYKISQSAFWLGEVCDGLKCLSIFLCSLIGQHVYLLCGVLYYTPVETRKLVILFLDSMILHVVWCQVLEKKKSGPRMCWSWSACFTQRRVNNRGKQLYACNLHKSCRLSYTSVHPGTMVFCRHTMYQKV